MKYLPIPTPVEGMQWLGPDNQGHVVLFKEFVGKCLNYEHELSVVGDKFSTWNGSFGWFLEKGKYFVFHPVIGVQIMSESDLLSRYTPADGEPS